ncbi:MAG: hypothetical protein F6K35_36700 [Okeania sp. SIO2H7]|nr:hypothetical protein [Okeania sp. SIO2H7]
MFPFQGSYELRIISYKKTSGLEAFFPFYLPLLAGGGARGGLPSAFLPAKCKYSTVSVAPPEGEHDISYRIVLGVRSQEKVRMRVGIIWRYSGILYLH